jgi:outer membrane autotransporter protein
MLRTIVCGCALLLLGGSAVLLGASDRAAAGALDGLPGQDDLQRRTGAALDRVCDALPAASRGDTGDLVEQCGALQLAAEVAVSDPVVFQRTVSPSSPLGVLFGSPFCSFSACLVQCTVSTCTVSDALGYFVPFSVPNPGLGPVPAFDAGELGQFLRDVAPDEVTALGVSSTRTGVQHLQTVDGRLRAVRAGARGFSLAGLRLRDAEGRVLDGADVERALAESAAAGGPEGILGERLGVFANGIGSWGDLDAHGDEPGYDFDTYGVLAGVDYRVREPLVLGAALGWSTTDHDFDRDAGGLDKDAWSGSLYGTWQREPVWVDGIVTYLHLDYGLERDFLVSGRTAEGDTTGHEWVVSLGVGTDLEHGGFTLSPSVRLTFLDTEIGGFSEDGAGGFDLVYDDHDVRSLTSDVGLNLSYALSTSFGVVTPYVRAEWEHEFEDDSREVGFRLAADPSRTRFAVRVSSPDRDHANLGAGLALALPRGWAAFADFETVAGQRNLDQYTLTVGGRLAF